MVSREVIFELNRLQSLEIGSQRSIRYDLFLSLDLNDDFHTQVLSETVDTPQKDSRLKPLGALATTTE